MIPSDQQYKIATGYYPGIMDTVITGLQGLAIFRSRHTGAYFDPDEES